MKNNELIARFMGGVSQKATSYSISDYPNELPSHILRDLKYHKSWDWLMPVVERIESMNYYTNIFKDEDGQQTVILHPVPSYQRNEDSMIVPNDPLKGNESKISTAYKAVVRIH